MSKDYRDERGTYVWRTVGGHRIKIYTGQTLSQAMKDSGKFKNKNIDDEIENEYKEVEKKNDELRKKLKEKYGDYTYKTNEDLVKERQLSDKELSKLNVAGGKNNLDKIREAKDKAKADYMEADRDWNELYGKQMWSGPDSDQWHKDLDALKDRSGKSREEYKKQLTDYMKYANDEDLTWQDKVGMNNILMEDELNEYNRKNDPFGRNANNEAIHDGYYEIYRNNERRNAKLKENAKPDEPYEYVEAYAGYKDKVSKHGDHDKWSGKEYTNDEFMEHLTDANWHHERRMLETAGLTNQELEYVKDHTTLSQWSADLDSKKTQKLIDEAKGKFRGKDKYYYGKEAYEKYGENILENFGGQRITKRVDLRNSKGGLSTVAKTIGAKDEYDVVEALEGMAKNGKAKEVYDGVFEISNERVSKSKASGKTFPRNMSKEIYEMDVDKGNAWSGNAVQKTANGEMFVSVRRNGPSQNSAEDIVREMTQRHPQLKAQISNNGNEIRFTLKDENTRTTSKKESIQEKYAGTIDYLQENTDMDLEEILELLKKRGK